MPARVLEWFDGRKESEKEGEKNAPYRGKFRPYTHPEKALGNLEAGRREVETGLAPVEMTLASLDAAFVRGETGLARVETSSFNPGEPCFRVGATQIDPETGRFRVDGCRVKRGER